MSEADRTQNIEAVLLELFNVASAALKSTAFSDAEKNNISNFRDEMWSNGHWLRFQIANLYEQDETSPEYAKPNFNDIDDALRKIIVSAFNIGSATWMHNGVRRYLEAEKNHGSAAHARNEREKLNERKEKIYEEVLMEFVPKNASTDQIREEIIRRFHEGKITHVDPPSFPTVQRRKSAFRKKLASLR